MTSTAHVDTFARDNLPPSELQPELIFDRPELSYPERFNCAFELLDALVTSGRGALPCILAPGLSWTYAELLERSNRIAHVLAQDMGVVAGNRVLLRGANTPMLAASWFAIMKCGAIAVTTMPLLKAKELTDVVNKAQISHALCDARLSEQLALAIPSCPTLLCVRHFYDPSADGVEAAMANKSAKFDNVDTAADDPCIIAFTSGTTGTPKGTVHFHRDILAICDLWPKSVLRATPNDVFIGSPPLAFTFGLGGLLLFPMRIGATTVLLEKARPESLLSAIEEYRATICFTVPTSYRAMAARTREHDLGTLRKCVSAGEALSAATREIWRDATGIELIDGLGTTEMLHIFVSSDEATARAGATGKAVPGYRACVMDENGNPAPPGQIGRLAVKGPTGCRYLADERQKRYVMQGWNYTGDAYLMDDDGYFVFQGRTDDMIISAGYNIGPQEIESVLLQHPDVEECAVVGVPDVERGHIVKAFVVLRDGVAETPELAIALKEHIKNILAPYKCPRAVEFRRSLPVTETGKLQRFRLREAK